MKPVGLIRGRLMTFWNQFVDFGVLHDLGIIIGLLGVVLVLFGLVLYLEG